MEEQIKRLKNFVAMDHRGFIDEIDNAIEKLTSLKRLAPSKFVSNEVDNTLFSILRNLNLAGRELEVRCRQLEMLRDMQGEAAAAKTTAACHETQSPQPRRVGAFVLAAEGIRGDTPHSR